MCKRSILVVDWLYLDIVVCLSATFSPFSLLDTGKPKCFHTSDLKYNGASAVSQTLSLGSPLSLEASATLALLLDLLSVNSAKDDGRARADGK